MVEDFARFDAQEGEVAGVEPDAGQVVTLLPQLLAHFNRVANTFE